MSNPRTEHEFWVRSLALRQATHAVLARNPEIHLFAYRAVASSSPGLARWGLQSVSPSLGLARCPLSEHNLILRNFLMLHDDYELITWLDLVL
ncbi:hypothetical protein QL285_026245 [Trifolium repens]|nr:hypothetical protein QL285_026245 [Trifolium repens]